MTMHWLSEPTTGAIPGLAWSRCGEVVSVPDATEHIHLVTCQKCALQWRIDRERKRKGAKP